MYKKGGGEIVKMSKFSRGYAKFGLLLLVCCYVMPGVSSEEEKPPEIRKPGEESKEIIVYRSKKQSFSFDCTADGNPKPSLQWRKDSIFLSETEDDVKAFSNGTLFFKEFERRNNGFYQCLATNKFGKSVSVNINIVYEQEPEISPAAGYTPQLVQAKEGEPLNLSCDGKAPTKPPYIHKWNFHKSSTELEKSGQTITPSQRISIDSEGQLRFVYVEKSDAGSYRCILDSADIAVGSYFIKYNIYTVNVDSQSSLSSKPRLEYSSNPAKAVLYNDRTLECFFSGKPVPDITWTDNNNQIVMESNERLKIDDSGRKLIIENVQAEDEGFFTCKAKNGDGETESRIHLNVTSAPQKLPGQGLSSITKPDTQDVTLMCKTYTLKGEHKNTPVWYRNGDPLPEANLVDPLRYSFSPDYTELRITNLSKSVDTACFQCNVSNSVGYAFYDGYLKVISSIKIIRRPADVIEVENNKVFDISVQHVGDECCPITKRWIHNEKVLLDKDLQTQPLVWDAKTESLFFNSTDVSDEALESRMGQYICSVSNTHQVVNVTFSIKKKAVPGPAVVEGAFEIWWIILIAAIVAIIIAIIIIIICVKRNYPRDTYPLEKTELKHNLKPEEELLNQSFQEI